MPKKESVSSFESNQSMSEGSDYDDEVSEPSIKQGTKKTQGLREVNRANILNYASDSSELEQGEDSDGMMPMLSKSQQKN